MTDFTKGIIAGITATNIGWIVANLLLRLVP